MYDLQLNTDGDLRIVDYDVQVTDSVAQAINIRLRWFYNEWIFGPDYGVDYFGRIFVKNPNEDKIIGMIQRIILTVDEVRQVRDITVALNNATRHATISYTAITDEETLREEVELWTTE